MNCAQCGKLELEQAMFIGVNLHGEVTEPLHYCRDCALGRVDIVNPPDSLVLCDRCGVPIFSRKAVMNGVGLMCTACAQIEPRVSVSVVNEP